MAAAAPGLKPCSSAPLGAQALAVGLFPAHTAIANLFARSHWALEHEATLAAAVARLGRERFAAVLCRAEEWKQIVEAIGALKDFQKARPVVIALSENPAKDDWLQAVANHVYFLDSRQLSAPDLFPLLNHAWRVCSASASR